MSQAQLHPLQAASVSDTPGSEGGTAGFVDQAEIVEPRADENEKEEEEISPS